MNDLSCKNDFIQFDDQIRKNSVRVQQVLILNTLVMFLEIYFGYVSGSMALLADGWHMATHAAALGISLLTYKLATHSTMTKNFNFGGGKIIALGGFTSSLFLLVVAGGVAFESAQRFISAENIEFRDAIWVAALGLVVNFFGAYLLRPTQQGGGVHAHHSHSGTGHHSHSGHSDINIKAAYIHIVADALTSVAAIVALLCGYYFGWYWLDALVGIISSAVILKWAFALIRETGWELLDGHAREIDFPTLRSRIEKENVAIEDLHIWKIGPGVLTAELVVKSLTSPSNPTSQIPQLRRILEKDYGISHSVIELR
jgi:cation diffusion facilitator family transporter